MPRKVEVPVEIFSQSPVRIVIKNAAPGVVLKSVGR
jgi:hypothetical protein